MGCKCVWCDETVEGIMVNISGDLMHEVCFDDYGREVEEVIDHEMNVEQAKEFVKAYAFA